jgi:diacylglycerol kinase (ATP)
LNRVDAVILNPLANAGNGRKRWKSLLESETAARAGLRDAPVFDGPPFNLQAWVSERLRQGARRFVAAGGDGTVHAVVNALMMAPERAGIEPEAIKLGAVGLGSSNDFQKPYLKEGREKAAGIACRLQFSQASTHDLGRATLDGVPRFFVINASIGVTAEANWQFNEARGGLGFLKRRWVDGAIVATALSAFAKYRNFDIKLAVGDEASREVSLTNLGVVKNVHFSGQMRYDLAQAPDDGLFGVHLCEGMSRLEMVKILSALSSGRFSGIPKTSSWQASRVEAASPYLFAVETDGEVTRARQAVFENLRRELRVCP